MRLSVIVTIVDGGSALERCLIALAAQPDPPDMEVIVPWDDTVPAIAPLAARFAGFRFLALGAVATARASSSFSGQHELFDRRRAAGLAAATGDVVAILEDRGVPRPDWARTLVRLHQQLPHAAIGGAIENGRDGLLNWAVFFCDFGRFQRPFDAGIRDWVSDINVGYKRRAVEQTRDAWRERYHETTVHWALQRAGEALYLTPELAVDQMRDGLRLGALLRERVAWGRLFAYTRVREQSAGAGRWLALLTPMLPILLLLRHARVQMAKRVQFRNFLKASPAVLVLLMAWSIGEFVGYMTGTP
jgi:hypothetical protein